MGAKTRIYGIHFFLTSVELKINNLGQASESLIGLSYKVSVFCNCLGESLVFFLPYSIIFDFSAICTVCIQNG